MTYSEKDIQNYIWENRNSWEQLITRLNLPEERSFYDDPSSINPEHLLHNQVLDRLRKIELRLSGLEIIGCEVPLDKYSDSTIRADFLGLSSESDGLVILELKKSRQTERQAFTELLAYSNHLTNIFSGMCREDIIYVLISPMETRIVKESFIQSLIFDKRPIFAFIPKLSDPNDISTLKLHPWIPTLEEMVNFTQVAFHPCNLDVFKVHWEDCRDDWGSSDTMTPDWAIRQFDYVASMAAQAMEEQGIHGFAYCSQTWTELSEIIPFSNSLVIVGMNPYSISSSIYTEETGSEKAEPQLYSQVIPNIAKLLPGLLKSGDENHLKYCLDQLLWGWRNHIAQIGFKVVELAAQSTTGSVFTDWGSMSWAEYKLLFFADVSCKNFSVRPTGVIRDLFWEVVDLDYELSRKGVFSDLEYGDLGDTAIRSLDNHGYFRRFIERMFGEDPNIRFRPIFNNLSECELDMDCDLDPVEPDPTGDYDPEDN